MNKRLIFIKISTSFLVLFLSYPAVCYQGLTVESGGGFSGNLYADSFSIGDSYLLGAFSLSDTEFKTTRLRIYYDLAYYQYDTRNSINQFNHLAGLSLFRRPIDDRVKWGIDLAGTYRDYPEDNSDYDNYRIFIRADASAYLVRGLQLKFLYQASSAVYSGFENLDHYEHRFESEVIKTLPSKTTVRGKIQYSLRKFDIDNSQVDWLNLETRLSQSVDIRTGLSGGAVIRLAGGGTRPLSSYYAVSGVTPYWDPWDGYQLNLSLKRIFPYGIIAIFDFDYWNRTFNYSQLQQSELPWLTGKESRKDSGWMIKADIDRQFNFYGRFGHFLRIDIAPGYVRNNSDDLYYEYDYFFINITMKLNLL